MNIAGMHDIATRSQTLLQLLMSHQRSIRTVTFLEFAILETVFPLSKMAIVEVTRIRTFVPQPPWRGLRVKLRE